MERKIRNLNREVAILRSAVLSVVGSADPEGPYKLKFVKEILSRARDKGERKAFVNAKIFLSSIKK